MTNVLQCKNFRLTEGINRIKKKKKDPIREAEFFLCISFVL